MLQGIAIICRKSHLCPGTSPVGATRMGSGRTTTRLSMVARTSFISCRLAPSIARPSGTPWPSVSRLRLTPDLPRSVGLGPVFSPPSGADRSSLRPSRASPTRSRTAHQTARLQLARAVPKNARFYPGLKPIVGCRMSTQFGLVQSLPVAAGAQNVEDRIGTTPIRDTGSSPAKAMRIDVDWQQWLQHGPQLIRNQKSRRGAIIRRPLSLSLLIVFVAHSPVYQVIRIGSKCNQATFAALSILRRQPITKKVT